MHLGSALPRMRLAVIHRQHAYISTCHHAWSSETCVAGAACTDAEGAAVAVAEAHAVAFANAFAKAEGCGCAMNVETEAMAYKKILVKAASHAATAACSSGAHHSCSHPVKAAATS